MNIRSKAGAIVSVKLLKIEQTYLESAQGICAVAAKAMAGDRAGELAATAEQALGELRGILDAAPVKALVSK